VVGNICETDTFAHDRQIAEIPEVDILTLQPTLLFLFYKNRIS